MATGSINISSNISRSEMILQNYPPRPCKDVHTDAGNAQIKIWWTDPEKSEDYSTTDGLSVEWKYSRVVRKIGSYPINETDGIIVIDSSIRNQYTENNPFIDKGLQNNVTYYYSVFACSAYGVCSREIAQSSATPIPYYIMTVKLNLNNSNPASWGVYDDDAVSMPSGKTEDSTSKWQKFFKYRPCLFKNGSVTGYLDPNDFTKYVDGSDSLSDMKSGVNVMIEFPRRGVKISTSNNTMSISMTDDPNNPNFKYYAHQRGSTDKDYFYLGAYSGTHKSNTTDGTLDSTRANNGGVSSTWDDWVRWAKANGTNYGCIGFYQYLYICIMYMLQFKGNTDCRSTVGTGHDRYSSLNHTYAYHGRSDTYGMVYGDDTVVKLFGLEDIWGCYSQMISNFYVTKDFHILTTTDDSITDVNKFTDHGTLIVDSSKVYSGIVSGFADGFNVFGTTELGFIASNLVSTGGSTSTYFCSEQEFGQGMFASFGGDYTEYTWASLFSFLGSYYKSSSRSSGGLCRWYMTVSRLQYL